MPFVNMNADKPATVMAFSASTLTRPKFSALPPLSLYVHIPWCLKKCPYCDFNSHEARDEVPQDAYVDALRQRQAAMETEPHRPGRIYPAALNPSVSN